MPQEAPTPTPEEIAQEAAAPPAEEQAAQKAPAQEAPPEEGFRVANRYMLLPPTVNFAQPRKTQPERNYDVGMLWDVLANDPQAEPLVRMIAQNLMNRGENG